MDCIQLPASFIINGQKSAGKTTLIKNILFMCKSVIKYVLILTESTNYAAPKIKHNICRQNGFAQYVPLLKKYNKYAILIVDDISKSSINKINNDNIIKKTILKNNISVIFSAQHTISIPKYLRDCSRYIMLFKTRGENRIQSMYNNYFKNFIIIIRGKQMSYDKFKKIINCIMCHDFIIFDRHLKKMQFIIFNVVY